jgi:FkbM family methyltransferase
MPSNISQYKYFSQSGEDYLLWNFFDYKEKGFYIDIGAFDGVHLSNSYSFELQGWSGICIEPHPYYFPLCEKNRIKSKCLNIACVGDQKVHNVEFYAEELGLLSSISDENIEDIKLRYQARKLEFHGFTKEKVKAMTLNLVIETYLKDCDQIDFISIDVEGTELDILKGFNFNKFSPRIFVIEANSEQARNALNLFMLKQGYTEARRLGVNIFYVENMQDYQKINSINISCHIEKNIHPKGEKFTITKCITGYDLNIPNTQSQLQQSQFDINKRKSNKFWNIYNFLFKR